MLKFLKKINFKTLFWFFFYLFLFSLLLRNSFNYLDPDLGWHLKVGQEIINTRAVPHINQYDYTFQGHWVDHEWLSNIGMFFIYSQGGYLTLSIVFALLIILVLVLLNIFAHRFWPKISPIPIVLFQFLGLIASLPHFGVRIQEIGSLFLLLLLIIIIEYNKHKNWRILLFLPLLIYLWANMHASFLLGLFLLVAWLSIKIGEKILFKFKPRYLVDYTEVLNWKEIKFFFGIIIASFGLTLLTPYKLALYSFLDNTVFVNTFYQSHLQEWLPQSSFPLQYPQLFYLALVVSALILYIYYIKKFNKHFKLSLWNIFLVVLFVFLSFKSRRHFPLMFVATFIFMIEVWKDIFGSDNPIKYKINKFFIGPWLKACILFCLLLLSVYQINFTRFTTKPFGTFCQNYPCGAVNFLKQNPGYNSLRIFNNYNWGGYLIWAYPQRKLFIDGRLPQVSFAGHSFLAEYSEFFRKNGNIGSKLAQYQIKLVLLSTFDKNLKLKNWEKFVFNIKNKDLINHNYLRNYLLKSKNWRIIYRDNTAVIYQRT